MKWYTDGSDLYGIKEAEIPDIVVFGGIAIPAAKEYALKGSIEKVKAEYATARAPVKWNMKDLETVYETQRRKEIYEKMLKSSADWRQQIFRCIADADATIILATIEGYSSEKKILKKTKESLTRFAFSNALMRFGLHAQERKAQCPTVVMDWPENSEPKPFNSEYAYAFGNGTTADGNVKYHCGKLGDLQFNDSLMFTNMRHSTMLQAADLVVGATRELFLCALGKREPGQGIECLKIVKAKFRGAPKDIIGRGISISSGNPELGKKIEAAVKEHLS